MSLDHVIPPGAGKGGSRVAGIIDRVRTATRNYGALRSTREPCDGQGFSTAAQRTRSADQGVAPVKVVPALSRGDQKITTTGVAPSCLLAVQTPRYQGLYVTLGGPHG